MTGRRANLGLCLLFALVLVAVGAQASAAATNGTTAFTCKNEGPEHAFAKGHCAAADQGGGEYEDVAIAENTSTALLGTAGTTGGGKEVTKLKFVLAGTNVELQAKGLDLEGSLRNLKAESGEHYVDGEGKIVYTAASVTVGGSCKVKGEKFETKPLTLTTKGQGDALKLAPAAGEVFLEFTIEGCPALSGTYKVNGSVKGTPDGATVAFTHAGTTAEGTLKLGTGGPKVGLEGSITFNGRDPVLEETSFAPLSFKTVETP